MLFKSKIIGIYILLFSVSGFAFAQNSKHNSTDQKEFLGNDSTDISEEIDNTLDEMLNSWVMERSTPSPCESSDVPESVPDSIYKERLAKLPCLMEMPFNSVIRSYIELYTVRKRRQVEFMMGMSDYYFPKFEEILGASNMPLELKYLPVIESALHATAVSRAGAAGLWQFMIGTGKMYGLEINSLVDERLDPVKATKVAARYFKDLYTIYGDWNLVIAAYNCGPGNVNKAIRRSGGRRDYWTIYPYLPRETRGYVPTFVAANYTMHYAKDHNLCAANVHMPAITDTIMVHQRIHLEQVADILNLPIEGLRLLNPQYKRDIVPGDIKPYALILPQNYINPFMDKYEQIISYKADSLINNRRLEIEIQQSAPISPGNSGKVVYHKVKRGETISEIADRYGVSVSKIKKWNHIRKSVVKKGQRIKIIK